MVGRCRLCRRAVTRVRPYDECDGHFRRIIVMVGHGDAAEQEIADRRRTRGRDLESAERCSFRRPGTPSSISRATTSPSPTARCAAPADGPTCSCAIRTASAASSSFRSARPSRGRRGSRSSRCVFRPAARPRRSCRAMPPRSSGWPTSPASSCTRIRCAPTISIIPTSCASISIRCPASSGRRSATSRRSCARRSTTSA